MPYPGKNNRILYAHRHDKPHALSENLNKTTATKGNIQHTYLPDNNKRPYDQDTRCSRSHTF